MKVKHSYALYTPGREDCWVLNNQSEGHSAIDAKELQLAVAAMASMVNKAADEDADYGDTHCHIIVEANPDTRCDVPPKYGFSICNIHTSAPDFDQFEAMMELVDRVKRWITHYEALQRK